MNAETEISGYVMDSISTDKKILCTSCYEHRGRKVFDLILRPSHAEALSNLECDECGKVVFPDIPTVDRLKVFEQYIRTLEI